MYRAIFFDRDGTIIHDPGYLSEVNQIKFFDGVLEKISQVKLKGFKIFIITNQSGVGRGYFTEEKLKQIHCALVEMMNSAGANVDDIRYCPHAPEENCFCRKPNPEMVQSLARKYNISTGESFFIGDKVQDVLTGKNSGCNTVLVLNGNEIETIKSQSEIWYEPDYIAQTTGDALDWIMKNY